MMNPIDSLLAKIHQARMHVFSHSVLFLERKLDV